MDDPLTKGSDGSQEENGADQRKAFNQITHGGGTGSAQGKADDLSTELTEALFI